MAVAPYTANEVDQFRERGDAFTRDMLQEYYDHFAGLKDTLDIERVYEEYEDLTRLETAQRLEHAPAELWRVSGGGVPGNPTPPPPAAAAGGAATLEATPGGEQNPQRLGRGVMSNEPHPPQRR